MLTYSSREHEWSKHGTCYSTLSPSCYTNYQAEDELVDFLNTTITLFKDLPTYQVFVKHLCQT